MSMTCSYLVVTYDKLHTGLPYVCGWEMTQSLQCQGRQSESVPTVEKIELCSRKTPANKQGFPSVKTWRKSDKEHMHRITYLVVKPITGKQGF